MALANPKRYQAQIAYVPPAEGESVPIIAKNAPVILYAGADRSVPLTVYNPDHTPRPVFRTSAHGIIPPFVLDGVEDAVAAGTTDEGVDFEVPLLCIDGITGSKGDPGTPGVQPTDEAIADRIDDTASDTYRALTDIFKPPTMASVQYYVNASPAYSYEVLKVKTFGRFVPKLVQKRFAFDYDKLVWDGNPPIAPSPRETIESAMTATGASILFNASGYSETTNEVSGVEITDGVIMKEIGTSDRGSEALGFRADGSTGTYSWPVDGHSAADMLNDGVVDSFAFAMLLMRNGVRILPESNPLWSDFNTTPSGRQILGQSAGGDIILITIHGTTGVDGALPNECSRLAQLYGCHNAIMLDGGGSAQTAFAGTIIHPSSDLGKMRTVPNFGVINTPIQGLYDTGWQPMVFRAGYTQDSVARAAQWRNRDGFINLRGRFRRTPAANFVTNAYSLVADLPKHVLPVNPQAGAGTAINGVGVLASVLGGTDSALYVRPMVPAETGLGLSYLDVGGFGYYIF